MENILITKHCKGRLYKRLRKLGVKTVNLKMYFDIIMKFADGIPNKYIKNPIKFRNLKWLHGLFTLVVVDDFFRKTRVVVTIIF